MEFEDLKKLADEGNLIVSKTEGNEYIRRLPIYSKTKGFWSEAFIDKYGNAKNEWFGDIEGYKDVSYRKIKYLCRTKQMNENEFWKITKKDYLILKK
jgi:hypothetical protein